MNYANKQVKAEHKAQRKAIAKVFKEAHDRMEQSPPWEGINSRHICFNIPNNKETRNAHYAIRSRISGYFSVAHWLESQGHISERFARAAEGRNIDSFEVKQMHQYRLRWLKDLIREFST
jgi:phenylalanyl-tRNA synthetase alpha subunit